MYKCRKAAIILSKISINISHDSIIRILKKLPNETVQIDEGTINIGIDDFAFKKSKEYCTLICDIDKKKILDILPSRSKKSVADWLNNYPNIKLVSRDGSITYKAAINKALPKAIQVSDKFHLIKNLLDYISKYVRRKFPKSLIISDMELDTSENIDNDKDKKNTLREEKIAAKWALMTEIKVKYRNGSGIRQLAREYSMARETIRKYLLAESPIYWKEGFKRGSKLDKFKNIIIELINEEKTHKEIFDIIEQKGYKGSQSALSAYMSRNNIKRNSNRRLQEYKNKPKPVTVSISSVIKAICKNSNNLKEKERKNLEKLKSKYPKILILRDIIEEFKNLFKGNSQLLAKWIDKAKKLDIPEINSFILGVERDLDSVKNSTTSGYTNGLLEGMVNKVKGIKRTSYGRCKFELLRLKVLNYQEVYG